MAAPDADEWLNVHGVGSYQQILAGRVPRAVEVELFPWDRTTQVTARVGGQRVGELSEGFAAKVHEVLAARRAAGLPPVVVPGEVRKGDYVPAYLAVKIPHWEKLDGWLASVTPEGWKPPRPAEEPARLHYQGHYQVALRELNMRYANRQRGVAATVEFVPSTGGKYAGQTMGLVSVDRVVFAEMRPDYRDTWQNVYDDYQAGTPGRLLVWFWVDDANNKYSARGVYKAPKPE